MTTSHGLRAVALLVSTLAIAGCGEEGSPVLPPASGVTGAVHLGPQCPVETPDEPCPDQPASGVTVVVAERPGGESYGAGRTVATASTAADGSFLVDVAPGEYVVTAEAGMTCEFMDVVVVEGEYAHMDVPCDTGIRGPAG